MRDDADIVPKDYRNIDRDFPSESVMEKMAKDGDI